MRVDHEKKSDGVRVHHERATRDDEKKGDGERVDHEKKSDG